MPNSDEVTKMQQLYKQQIGKDITREEAYEALTTLVHFIYLTEYEPVRPLRPQEPIEKWRAKLNKK